MNNFILLIIILIVFTLSLKLLYMENFTINDKSKDKQYMLNNVIRHISNNFNDLDNNENDLPLYLATFIPENNQDIKKGNLIYTHSLESNKWYGPLKNSNPERNTIIIDLTYGHDKKLIGIGLKIEDNKKVYTFYKKESLDLNSKWIKYNINDDLFKGKIMSLIYDNQNNSILLGINSDDGQVYKFDLSKNNSKWVGPINYDLPMKKILYDKDNYLLGIGLKDNFIYKKKSKNWKKSLWSKDFIKSEKVNDLLHDVDGSLIAVTLQGLKKQKNPNFLSDFHKLSSVKERGLEELLSSNDILKYKTGLELIDELELDNSLRGNQLKNVLVFKKNMVNMCKNREMLFKQIDNNTSNMMSEIKLQNKTMDNIKFKLDMLNKKYDV